MKYNSDQPTTKKSNLMNAPHVAGLVIPDTAAPMGQTETGAPIRRYLFLGEGGSGIEDLRRRKQLLVVWGREWNWQGQVRFLSIDNDDKYQAEFAPGEFVAWDELPLGDFLRAKLAHPDRFPGLNRFGSLPALLQDLQPVEVVNNGFRGNRGLGGVGYEYMATMHGDQMVADLLTPVLELCGVTASHQVAGNGALPGTATFADPGGQLIISQSLASGGAKGSPAALPDAWLLRIKTQELGLANVCIDCTVYLPETFNTSRQQQRRIQAHTEAWFRELKAIYTRDLPPLTLGRYQVRRTPVYRLIRLLNGVDEQGQRVYSQEDVYAIGAATGILSSIGPIADHFESLIPNIVDDLTWPYVCYSQNCHQLVAPVTELQTLFGYQLLELVMPQQLLRQPDMATVAQSGKQQARQWLTRHRLAPQQLAQVFAGERSLQLAIDLKAYRRLGLPELQKAVAQYEQATFKTLAPRLNKFVATLAEQLAQSLVEEVSILLHHPVGGIRAVPYFLGHDPQQDVCGLLAFLADLKSVLVKRQTHVQQALQQARARLAARPHLLQRLLPAWVSNRKRRWLRHKQQELSWRWMEQLLQAQLLLIEHLEQQVQDHHRQLVTWIGRLEQATQLVTHERAQYAQRRRQRPVYETNVFTAAEEAGLFRQRQEAAFTLAGQDLTWHWQSGTHQGPAAWVLQLRGQPAIQLFSDDVASLEGLRPLIRYGQRLFAGLDALDIEQVLTDQGRDPVQMIEQLKAKNPVLVGINLVADHLQQGSKSPGLRREVILGTPHGGRGFFRTAVNQAGGFQIVATGQQNRHRIVLLTSLFNINPFALAQSAAYAQAYEELKAAGHALHIFAEEEIAEMEARAVKQPTRRKPYVQPE